MPNPLQPPPPVLGLQKAAHIGADPRAEAIRRLGSDPTVHGGVTEASVPDPEKPGGFAIPLFNHGDYLRRVAGEALEDLGDFGRRVADDPIGAAQDTFGFLSKDKLAATQRLTNATEDPDLSMMVHSTINDPGVSREIFQRTPSDYSPHGDNPELNRIIQALADAYHTKLGFK